MAVQQDRIFSGSIPVPNAYVRIVKGSIRGGGPGGWSCVMEAFAKAEDSKIVEVPRTIEEIPAHMRYDPQSGQALDAEAQRKIADALPRTTRQAGQHFERFEFPQASAPGTANIVPDDGETHPAKALYGAFMERNPASKAV